PVAVAFDEALERVRRVELAVDLRLLDARDDERVGYRHRRRAAGTDGGRRGCGRAARREGGRRAALGRRAPAGRSGGGRRGGRGRAGGRLVGGLARRQVHRRALVAPLGVILLDDDVVEEPALGPEHLRDRLAQQAEVVLLQPLVIEPARELDRQLDKVALVLQVDRA